MVTELNISVLFVVGLFRFKTVKSEKPLFPTIIDVDGPVTLTDEVHKKKFDDLDKIKQKYIQPVTLGRRLLKK